MKSRHVFSVFGITLLCFTLTACPNRTDKKSHTGAGVRTIKGDPEAFIRHAVTNNGRALPPELIPHGSRWSISLAGFQEGPPSTYQETLAKQQPGEASADEIKIIGQAESLGSELVIQGHSAGETVTMAFARSVNGLNLISAAFAKNFAGPLTDSFKLLHTSYKTDGSAFSLLIHKTIAPRGVFGLYFSRVEPGEKASSDGSAYEYLFGRGKKVGWQQDRPLELRICGSPPHPLSQLVSRATEAWSQVLRGRLDFASVAGKKCPPFSDVNTRTFTYVSDWIEIAGEEATMAQTWALKDESRQNLLDSDIFYLTGEIQESLDLAGTKMQFMSAEFLNSPKVQQLILMTNIHEIGHLLGLHHKFDGTPSIMSYDENRTGLKPYDVQAIQHLYPLKSESK